jgi:hypothetical protein
MRLVLGLVLEVLRREKFFWQKSKVKLRSDRDKAFVLTPRMVSAIQEWPVPRNVHDVSLILGPLINYSCKVLIRS